MVDITRLAKDPRTIPKSCNRSDSTDRQSDLTDDYDTNEEVYEIVENSDLHIEDRTSVDNLLARNFITAINVQQALDNISYSVYSFLNARARVMNRNIFSLNRGLFDIYF